MIIPAAACCHQLSDHYENAFTEYKLGVILPSSTKAFSIILLRQAYLGIPKELIEAAKLDGAGELKIWKNVMIPGILPSVSTIVIFDFIANWNAFLWPIIVLQDPEKYPLATALQYLNGSFSYKFGYVASGTIISIIPVLIVFMNVPEKLY